MNLPFVFGVFVVGRGLYLKHDASLLDRRCCARIDERAAAT
jgi:hypothetical protein